jgi:hypothetical protein
MAGNTTIGNGRLGTGWRLLIWGGAAALLMLPAVAMQFTTEVDWDARDFIIIAVMLSALCGAIEFGARLSASPWYRAAVAVGAGASFLLVWVNLAVGMVGSEQNAYNLWFASVLGVGLVGALLARFQPRGMAMTLMAMAVVQAVVGGTAFIAGWDPLGSTLSTLWAGFWVVSAVLFWQAALK